MENSGIGEMNQFGQGNGWYSQNQAKGYNVDMVFCIDATASMEDADPSGNKLINMVKKNAISFYSDLMEKMNAKNKRVSGFRIRIIAFRDYQYDGDEAMLATDFFTLPDQTAVFYDCVRSIHAKGGGDIPEDGMEALAYAIRSKWSEEGTDQRRVIVVWTDAPTHPIRFSERAANYPKGMPSSLSELGDWWDQIPMKAKRLILYTPDAPDWDYIAENWDNVIHFPSVAGNGLEECDYSSILDVLVQSITK